MQFSNILSFTAAFFVASAIAQPHANGPLSIHQSKTKCSGGQVACCLNKSDIHADGILSGALTRGLLVDVLGSSDQACAKLELIENLNLLGFTKQDQNGQTCSTATACCPGGGDSCHHV